MYTDEDLNIAVKKGIFTPSAVSNFRTMLSESKNTPAVDEEKFKLIGGFNDIFILNASALLLFSTAYLLKGIDVRLALVVTTLLAWGLSEIFVRKRKMALPSIGLLLLCIGGVFASTLLISKDFLAFQYSLILASFTSVIATYLHWLRFKVPITIAVGSAAFITLLLTTFIILIPSFKDWFMGTLLASGIMVFLFAMYWDSVDTQRITKNADIAFWLHLLAAPLIIHPIFSYAGVFKGDNSIMSMLLIILLYITLTTISLAIDRRALMISSLVYALYSLSSLLKNYGGISENFAFASAFMGLSLLILAVYWHHVRSFLVKKLPKSIQQYLPKAYENRIHH